MDERGARYELPETSGADVRRMSLWLAACFAALLILVGLAFHHAQALAQRIPFAAEQRFVRPYESLIADHLGFLAGDPEIAAYLDALVDDIERAWPAGEDIDVTVHYVDTDEVNALATLGGHVFVFRGLLESLPDENALVMVLAHEMAHVRHRDPAAGLSRGLALELLYGFLASGGTGGTTTDVVGGLGLSLFSREQERLADLAALDALHARYGHVGGYDAFFEGRLASLPGTGGSDEAESEPTRVDGWFASHPAVRERLRYLGEAIDARGFSREPTRPFPAAIERIVHPDDAG